MTFGWRSAGVVALGLLLGSQARAADPAPENWADKIKNPVPWFNWGADERDRYEYIPNLFLTNADPPGYTLTQARMFTRLWASVMPCDDFSLNARVVHEGRYFWEPESVEGWDGKEGIIDNLNAKIKIPAVGLTVTVGRQDMKIGSGWLLLEGTPLDAGRTTYFDAVRATLDAKSIKTTFDGAVFYDSAYNNAWLGYIGNGPKKLQIEQNETGAVLDVANKSLESTQIEPYFMYKQGNKVAANGYDAEIYAPGMRVIQTFNKNLAGSVEGVYEFGEKNSERLRAWGLTSRLTCSLNDDLNNQFWIGYEALSGDDPSTGTNEQFDSLWGRYPQWSELYVYTYAIENRIADATNLQRINLGWQCAPIKNLGLAVNYDALFAFENTRGASAGFSNNGKFRGHLLTGLLTYKFNRFLSGNLEGEVLLPGNYYDNPKDTPYDTRRDPAAYMRAEMVVTF